MGMQPRKGSGEILVVRCSFARLMCTEWYPA